MHQNNIIKPLYITMSTDLGSKSQSIALKDLLGNEFDFFEFDLKNIYSQNSFFKKYFQLILIIMKLRIEVRRASIRGSKIIFFNLKPALFTFDIWNSRNAITCSDFSHSLFNWHRKIKIKKNIRFYFQKLLFARFYKILTWTENLRQCLHEVYEIPLDKIIKVPLPLEFELFKKKPEPVINIPKVLFVGGDFERKGGNYLIEAWETKLKGKCELYIVTQKVINSTNGIKVFNNISKGSTEHIELFNNSDIFILPTKQDAFPYVLGEAAISGLTIITSKYALGSNEVINHGKSGFISETPDECIDYLLVLLNDKDLIYKFKCEMKKDINKNFSKEIIIQKYINAIT
jgi:glycosyltransferase involved in cell wall biosynthesis